MTRWVARAVGLASVSAVLVACGVVAPTPAPSIGASPSILGPATSSPASPSVAAETPTASGLIAEPRPDLFGLIADRGTQGLAFRYDPDTTARVGADPSLAADASQIAIGLYTIAGQDPAEDLAIVSILRLRDPEPTDDWFRAYRDSYDESACAQAGGVSGHAEAQIGGRTVFIGSCAGGAFTYHVHLVSNGAVVSITSVGAARLGERLADAIES